MNQILRTVEFLRQPSPVARHNPERQEIVKSADTVSIHFPNRLLGKIRKVGNAPGLRTFSKIYRHTVSAFEGYSGATVV